MHSSRMRTVRCSGRRGGGVVCPSACWNMSAGGGSAPVHAGICLPKGGVCPSAHTPPVNTMTDRQVQKHYPTVTTLRTVITSNRQYLPQHCCYVEYLHSCRLQKTVSQAHLHYATSFTFFLSPSTAPPLRWGPKTTF